MAVKPIPEGYHTLIPYLICRDASAAIAFYTKAFGAKEYVRMPAPDGRIMHAEMKIGDSVLMLADEAPEMGASSPHTVGGTPVGLCLYIADVDVVVPRAIDAGAKVERPLKTQFYGDRSATLIDPFGHKWTIATHVEDVTPEEMDRRMKEMPQS
jgi:PhnB protein